MSARPRGRAGVMPGFPIYQCTVLGKRVVVWRISLVGACIVSELSPDWGNMII